ncbi:beta-1,3-galactosyltransferase 5-like [Physella acuta]|uniref:beta-1,3-galactosyltransferase 5-like n=1 Tax=Physella acuta TaxID=109671 RepID=UPI0027DE7D35|nr:beta-1,3-galactosyltransferase 5-like [Physella acuta]
MKCLKWGKLAVVFLTIFTLITLIMLIYTEPSFNVSTVTTNVENTANVEKFTITDLIVSNKTSTQWDICERLSNVLNVSCVDCVNKDVRNVVNNLIDVPLVIGKNDSFFTPGKEIVQEFVNEILITPRTCTGDCPYILALQLSVADRKQERDAVRETWGSVSRHQTWPRRHVRAGVKVVFVVGGAEENSSLSATHRFNQTLEELKKESEIHGDVLFLRMTDTYRNITLKLVSALKWVTEFCPLVKFVLKVDFDTYVNVPLLVDTVLALEKRLEFSILGYIYRLNTNVVHRSGRWAVDRALYPLDYYPYYASGCAYLISSQALNKLIQDVPYVRVFPVEDAFITGVMRNVIKCNLFSMEAYFTHYNDRLPWGQCELQSDRKIVSTGVDVDTLKRMWSSLENNKCN